MVDYSIGHSPGSGGFLEIEKSTGEGRSAQIFGQVPVYVTISNSTSPGEASGRHLSYASRRWVRGCEKRGRYLPWDTDEDGRRTAAQRAHGQLG